MMTVEEVSRLISSTKGRPAKEAAEMIGDAKYDKSFQKIITAHLAQAMLKRDRAAIRSVLFMLSHLHPEPADNPYDMGMILEASDIYFVK